jgi:hypothetical protein
VREVVELHQRTGNAPVGVHEVIQFRTVKKLSTAWFAMRVNVPSPDPSVESCAVNSEMTRRFVEVAARLHLTRV